MKLSIINGSPKLGKSTSSLLIDDFLSKYTDPEVRIMNVNRGVFNDEDEAYVSSSDALLFVFPLYIDSIPSHLLKLMVHLEQVLYKKPIHVYCILNNGFFEGKQNQYAINQMKLWCEKTCLCWGQGMGVGAGEMIPIVKDIPLGYGPNTNLGNSLTVIANHISHTSEGEDLLICLNWPRFMWRIQSSMKVWLPRARKNGLKIYQMYHKMVQE